MPLDCGKREVWPNLISGCFISAKDEEQEDEKRLKDSEEQAESTTPRVATPRAVKLGSERESSSIEESPQAPTTSTSTDQL